MYITILQMLKLPDGTVKVLVERAPTPVSTRSEEGEAFRPMSITGGSAGSSKQDRSSEIEALRRAVLTQFDQYVKLNKKILTEISAPSPALMILDDWLTPSPHTYLLKLENNRAVLGCRCGRSFGKPVSSKSNGRWTFSTLINVSVGVKRQMEKNQRDFYLNEQVKAIQKELGRAKTAPTLKRSRKDQRPRCQGGLEEGRG